MEAVASPSQQRWQKRILALCWVSYALSYLCRTNLSCIAGNDGAAALVGGESRCDRQRVFYQLRHWPFD